MKTPSIDTTLKAVEDFCELSKPDANQGRIVLHRVIENGHETVEARRFWSVFWGLSFFNKIRVIVGLECEELCLRTIAQIVDRALIGREQFRGSEFRAIQALNGKISKFNRRHPKGVLAPLVARIVDITTAKIFHGTALSQCKVVLSETPPGIREPEVIAALQTAGAGGQRPSITLISSFERDRSDFPGDSTKQRALLGAGEIPMSAISIPDLDEQVHVAQGAQIAVTLPAGYGEYSLENVFSIRKNAAVDLDNIVMARGNKWIPFSYFDTHEEQLRHGLVTTTLKRALSGAIPSVLPFHVRQEGFERNSRLIAPYHMDVPVEGSAPEPYALAAIVVSQDSEQHFYTPLDTDCPSGGHPARWKRTIGTVTTEVSWDHVSRCLNAPGVTFFYKMIYQKEAKLSEGGSFRAAPDHVVSELARVPGPSVLGSPPSSPDIIPGVGLPSCPPAEEPNGAALMRLEPASPVPFEHVAPADIRKLVNPHCLCYSNAFLVGFFASPAFRAALWSVDNVGAKKLQSVFVDLAQSRPEALERVRTTKPREEWTSLDEFDVAVCDSKVFPSILNIDAQQDSSEFALKILDWIFPHKEFACQYVWSTSRAGALPPLLNDAERARRIESMNRSSSEVPEDLLMLGHIDAQPQPTDSSAFMVDLKLADESPGHTVDEVFISRTVHESLTVDDLRGNDQNFRWLTFERLRALHRGSLLKDIEVHCESYLAGNLPPFLPIHVVREKFQEVDGCPEVLKTRVPLGFSYRMQVPTKDKRKVEYKLSAVICHQGSSATSGHYYVRMPNTDTLDETGEPTEWVYASDSSERKITLYHDPDTVADVSSNGVLFLYDLVTPPAQ
jgi:hypothetical protein